jgi:NTE family protein
MTPPGAITLVLGAGGTRGVAHAGVLRRLRAERIPIDTIVGCSVGAIVAGLYAGVGMEPDEMVHEARRLGPAALLHFAVSRWRLPFVSGAALRRSAGIPEHLERLKRASFGSLHHGVRRLGILAFDLSRWGETLILGGPGAPSEVPLHAAVKGSAAIPGLFPPLRTMWRGRRCLLVDAGLLSAVPIERAFAPPVAARRVIAVDLGLRSCLRQARRSYWDGLHEACGDHLVVLRPAVRGTGTIVPRGGDVDRLARAGEVSLDGAALDAIRAWVLS